MKEKLKKVGLFVPPWSTYSARCVANVHVLAILQTPNLPRKLDKFSNYVHHNFKVTDDKVCPTVCGSQCAPLVSVLQVKKQLWEFAQKVRVGK